MMREYLHCSHALIIPEFEGEADLCFFDEVAEIIKESTEYPVLALGNSAIVLMSAICNQP
jgi:hypothetical protein